MKMKVTGGNGNVTSSGENIQLGKDGKKITDDSNKTELGLTKESNTNEKINPEASTFLPQGTAPAIASIKLNNMTEDTDIKK